MEIETSTGFKLKLKAPGLVDAGVISKLQKADGDEETSLAGLGAILGFVVDHPAVKAVPRPPRDPETGKRTLGAWLDYGETVADALLGSGDMSIADIPALSEGLKAVMASIGEARVKN